MFSSSIAKVYNAGSRDHDASELYHHDHDAADKCFRRHNKHFVELT